jgi:hypothetical protein
MAAALSHQDVECALSPARAAALARLLTELEAWIVAPST